MQKIPQIRFLIFTALICVVLSFVFVWSGWSAKPAYANGPCQGPQNNYVGTVDRAVAVIAVSVNLNSRQPLLCNGSNGVSAAAVFTGIVASENGNCGWAQVGYFKEPKLAIKVYAEYNKNDCDFSTPPSGYKKVVWGTGQNGVHTYQVKYNTKKHLARFWYGEYLITKTPFDPGTAWGAQPWHREWVGETHDPGDDMPGSLSNPVNFTNLLYQNCQGCGWVDPGIPTTMNTLPSRYGLQQDAGSSFHIWTK